MDLPCDAGEWSSSDCDIFRFFERKAVVLRKLEDDEQVHQQTLYTKNDWETWFREAQGISTSWENLQPGLYVILCSRAAPIFDYGKQAPASYLPFTKGIWERLARELRTPREIRRTISRNVACFSSMRKYDGDRDRMELSFTARMAEALPDDLALSTTHIPATGSTFAVVYGCTELQMEEITGRIRRAGNQLHHPMLMPGVFVELERKRLLSFVERVLDDFVLRADHLENEPWDPATRMNTEETHKYLSLCLRSRSLIDHIKAVKRQLSKFSEELDVVAEEMRLREDNVNREKEQVIAEVGREMKKRIRDVMDEFNDKMDDCNMVICNTSLAMQTVWNHIARQDSKTNTDISKANAAIAWETKHESAQMRTIALLTMIYLPLSSVAAIFSMDMFNWEANTGESVVSKHIWLFAALSAGLTMITLVAWFLGTRRAKRMTRKSKKWYDAPERQNSLEV